MPNAIQSYEYAELINLIHSLEAERFRLLESEAQNSTAMRLNAKRLRESLKLASRLAVERGIESACADMGIEPERSRKGLAVVLLTTLFLAAGVAYFLTRPVEAAHAPQSVPPIVEVTMAVPEPEQAEIETSQAVAPVRVLTSTDGKPTADQIQTVREICAVSYDELYGDQMAEWNISRDEFVKTCEADLLGIAWQETKFNCGAVGDDGNSLGCYQIHAGYHDVGDTDREDFAFAAAWTLDRLVGHGYPHYRTSAIKSHNGSGPAADNYAASVKAWANNYLNR